MERVKDPSPEIELQVGQESYLLTWYNTLVYVYEKDSQVNHVYYVDEDSSFIIFDNQNLMDTLLEQGFPMYTAMYSTEEDLEHWLDYQAKVLELELDEL